MLLSTWNLETFFSLFFSSHSLWSFLFSTGYLCLFSPFTLFHYWQSLKIVELTNVVPLVGNKYQTTNLTLKHGDMVWEVIFVLLDKGRLVLNKLPGDFFQLLHVFTIRTLSLCYVELLISYNLFYYYCFYAFL